MPEVRRAFLGGLLHGAMLAVAYALTSTSTVIPAFIQALTGSPLAVGGVVGAMQLGGALAGLPAARWVEAARYKKVFLYLAIGTRALAFLVLAVLTWTLAKRAPGLVLGTLAFFLLVFAVAGGLGGVAYLPVIGKAIPRTLWGQFFGLRGVMASLAGALSGVLSRPLWDRFPEGFAAAFFLAFLALAVGFWGFWMIPERPDPKRPPLPLAAVLRPLAKPRLRRLLLAYLLVGTSFLALPFYVVAAQATGLPATALGYLVAISALADSANLLIGRWIDRRGAHVGVRAVAVLAFLVPVAALAGRGLAGALVVFALIGVIYNGIENAYSAYLLACAPPEERAAHTALLYLASAPRAVWPLLGGALAGVLGYPVLFLVTALLLALAALLAFGLQPA